MQKYPYKNRKISINKLLICLLMLNMCSFSFSQTTAFVDTLFVKRLNSLHLTIELPYNEMIEKNIMQMTHSENNKIESALGHFFQEKNYIDSLFKQASLPSELQYLPLASTQMGLGRSDYFNSAGIWQIPYYIAVNYGLIINDNIDERYDIHKATPVAIAYLQKISENYTNLWDVIIAYANSISALEAAKIRAQTNNDIWILYSNGNLPNKEIIPDYITWVYLAHYYQSHHIKLISPTVHHHLKCIYLQKNIPAELFITTLELNKNRFRQCNPVLIGNEIPSHYKIYIPEEKLAVFSRKEDTLYAIANSLATKIQADTIKSTNQIPPSAQDKTIYYTVKKGDVLGQIAQKNNTTVSQLKEWNNLKNDNIQIGQQLIVHQNNSSNPVAKSPTVSSAVKKTVYTVKSGDTLSKIAKTYNVTVDDIKKWNNLKSDRIDIGQKLMINR